MPILNIPDVTWKTTPTGIVPEIDFYECPKCQNGLYGEPGNCGFCGLPISRALNKEAVLSEHHIDQIVGKIRELEITCQPLDGVRNFLVAYHTACPNGKHIKYVKKMLVLPVFYRYFWIQVTITAAKPFEQINIDEIVKENPDIEKLQYPV